MAERAYDVIVIGSGAAGGIAAYVLGTAALNVLYLEAGRMIDPAKDFHTHRFPFDWRYRGQGKPGQYGKLPQGMEWKIKEWTDHLYTIPASIFRGSITAIRSARTSCEVIGSTSGVVAAWDLAPGPVYLDLVHLIRKESRNSTRPGSA